MVSGAILFAIPAPFPLEEGLKQSSANVGKIHEINSSTISIRRRIETQTILPSMYSPVSIPAPFPLEEGLKLLVVVPLSSWLIIPAPFPLEEGLKLK